MEQEMMTKEQSMKDEADRSFEGHDYQKAFELYSQCAEEGDVLSKCRMGVMYYEGQGVDKRPIKAFELIEGSYDPDHPETVFQLGKCHFEGIGTPVNKELGFEMIISVAENGHPAAENYIAALYLTGEYVQKDVEKGLSWLRKAVSHGDPKALYNMGNFLYKGKYVGMNEPQAISMWKKASHLHYPPAIGKFGDSFLKKGVDEDSVKKGLELLEEAARLGDGDAAEHLADHYMRKPREKEKVVKAVEFFKIALENGNKKAAFDLGTIYVHYSELRDYKTACRYFKEGHENRDIRCSFEYAIMKSRGQGTKRDDELAFKIFLECAEKGHAGAMGWVGHCYYEGIGVNPDEYRAREWFERGHEKGNEFCTMRLAEFYFCGRTVDLDRDRGLRLLRESFEKGETFAAYRLGDLYETHSAIKSIPDAIFWYMEGAKKGDVDCMMRLAGHYESGAFISRSEEKAFDLYQAAYKKDSSSVAAAEIGRCFEEGIGTEADVKTATTWYLKAVRRNAFAMWRLYNIYLAKKDTERAVFWLRRSAAAGSVSAMVDLAKIYEEGKLVPKSDLKAMQWYHKAADEGNEFAKARFEELIRFDPQDSEDISDYEMAVREIGEDEDDKGIMSLAERLVNGDGMPVNLNSASMWYEIAMQFNMDGAKDGLKKVRSMMKGERQFSDKQTTLD